MSMTAEQLRVEVNKLVAQYLVVYPDHASLPTADLRRAAARIVLREQRGKRPVRAR